MHQLYCKDNVDGLSKFYTELVSRGQILSFEKMKYDGRLVILDCLHNFNPLNLRYQTIVYLMLLGYKPGYVEFYKVKLSTVPEFLPLGKFTIDHFCNKIGINLKKH